MFLSICLGNKIADNFIAEIWTLLLGASLLITFIDLLRKSVYAASIQEKSSWCEKLTFCNSSANIDYVVLKGS